MIEYSGSVVEGRGKYPDGKGEGKTKTVIFEREYDTDINNFSATAEVDEFIEKQKGRKLGVVDLDLFPIKDYDINTLFEAAIKKSGREIFYDFIHLFSK